MPELTQAAVTFETDSDSDSHVKFIVMCESVVEKIANEIEEHGRYTATILEWKSFEDMAGHYEAPVNDRDNDEDHDVTIIKIQDMKKLCMNWPFPPFECSYCRIMK